MERAQEIPSTGKCPAEKTPWHCRDSGKRKIWNGWKPPKALEPRDVKVIICIAGILKGLPPELKSQKKLTGHFFTKLMILKEQSPENCMWVRIVAINRLQMRILQEVSHSTSNSRQKGAAILRNKNTSFHIMKLPIHLPQNSSEMLCQWMISLEVDQRLKKTYFWEITLTMKILMATAPRKWSKEEMAMRTTRSTSTLVLRNN